MSRHLSPENDYRFLAGHDPGSPRLTVAVIIPVYQRVALLRRTLAGLAAQTGYPSALIEVIVADDGSTEDVPAAVAEVAGILTIRSVRRERSGYGAGAARNLGAAATGADVLLFLDADCLPVPGLIAAHMAWHHRSREVVVIGSRRHVDSSGLDPAVVAAGGVDIAALAGSDLEPDDWRRTLYRRTNRLAHGSEAFRAVVSNNVSISRRWFSAVGGFSESFTRWGGEDTELGWRLWQRGLWLVPEDRAAILHQGQDDGDRSWRHRDRRQNTELIESLVPHRFYRKDLTRRVAGVPKVGWVVASPAGRRAGELLDQMRTQRVADWEARFPLDRIPGGDPRVKGASDPAGDDGHRVLRAIADTSAEYVALVSGAAGLDPLLLDRTVRSLDRSQRASLATVAIDGGEAAAAWSPFGIPPFALVRRREWAKVLPEVAEPAAAWRAVAGISRSITVPETLLRLPPPAPVAPPSVTPSVSTRTRAAEAARTGGALRRAAYRFAARMLRRTRRGDGGFAVAHLGDGRSLAAFSAACRWARPVEDGAVQGVVFGGGCIIDAALAERFALLDSPRVERVVAGAGLGPDPGAWLDVLAGCAAIGLATGADVDAAGAAGISAMAIGHPADDPAGAADCFEALLRGMS